MNRPSASRLLRKKPLLLLRLRLKSPRRSTLPQLR
jgi:hypothetical protein